LGNTARHHQAEAGEQALRESEERLRRISDATQDSIWEIDLKTNQLWWANERDRCLGAARRFAARFWEDWYDRIHPKTLGESKPV